MSKSTKPAAKTATKPARTARPAKAIARRKAPKSHNISHDIRTLAAEVKDLRSLRSKYDQLLSEHNGLLGALRELSS